MPSQTLRLNVRAVKPVRNLVPPGPCSVALNFTNADGLALDERGARVSLTPGQASFLELSGAIFGIADTYQRHAVHPVVKVLPNGPLLTPCAGVAATLEVIDVTGQSSVLPDPNIFTIEDPNE